MNRRITTLPMKLMAWDCISAMSWYLQSEDEPSSVRLSYHSGP